MRTLLAGVCAAALVLGAGSALAQEPAPAAKEPAAKVSPDARKVLDRMRAHYAGLKGAQVTLDVSVEGGGVKQSQSMSAAFERPSRVAFRSAPNAPSVYLIICDGESVWNYMGDLKKYTQEPAPGSFAGVMDSAAMGQHVEPGMILMSPHMMVLALMDGARFSSLVDGADRVEVIGTEELNGHKQDRLRLTGEQGVADFWVRAGEEAWLDQMSPDLTKFMMGEGAPKMEMRAVYKEWKKREDVKDDAFAFKPPEGSQKVKSLMDAMRAEEEPGLNLLGLPAPEVALDLLDGGKMTLSSHKDKNIVIMDFWATWCPPCVKGLPVVSKVAADFKDKGVVFYALDQGETPEVVKEFLAKKELKITVAMDPDQKAGQAYGVTGIPQTVIIGKDGTVQAVHTGFMPGMEKELAEQIQALVDGKTLAKPPEPEKPKPQTIDPR